MKCKICNLESRHIFSKKVLRKYQVKYFFCNYCGYLQTEDPYWLEEAYYNAIADADTGLVSRNINISRKLGVLLFLMKDENSRYVDYAGGTGMLVRMMRDIGFDFSWHDPYCDNIHARGFEFKSEQAPAKAVTAFEVLEHVINPIDFIADALLRTQSDTFIFSTELYKEKKPPMPEDWWYYSFQTGQHISFYHRSTLEKISKNLKMKMCSHGGIHMFTKRSIPESLFKLATGRASRLISPIMYHKMKSKTMDDHRLMLGEALSNDDINHND